MTITTIDQLVNALANNSSRVVIDKASIASQANAQITSYWRATGQPAQAAIPTTAQVPTKNTLGAIAFDNQTAPATSYLGWLVLTTSAIALVEFHDRIAHLGGLVLNVTTSQTVTGLDLQTLAPPADRLGASNYSDGQWFLEVYTDGGATGSNATINVTYDDGTTGNLTVQAVGGTLRAGRLLPLTPLIPTANQGKFIRGINSVILSASTGTAGNFGFTYLRQRTGVFIPSVNTSNNADWALLGLPQISNDSCVQIVTVISVASALTIRGQGKIAHG